MPIIFSTSSLALPATLARFTGLDILKKAAVALIPGGSFYLPTNVMLMAFFNYYYTFLQLDPDDLSEQLKRQGASITLVRPGKNTVAFIKTGFLMWKSSRGSTIKEDNHKRSIGTGVCVWDPRRVAYC